MPERLFVDIGNPLDDDNGGSLPCFLILRSLLSDDLYEVVVGLGSKIAIVGLIFDDC